MSEKPLISRPALIATLTIAAGAFVLFLVLSQTTPYDPPRAGNDSRSISAIGNAGLYELLRREDVPVARNLVNAAIAPTDDDLLLMIEPPPYGMTSEEVQLFERAKNVLLVLPKRRATADPDNLGWVKTTTPQLIDSVTSVARMIVDPKLDVVRTDPPVSWSTNELGLSPSVVDAMQVIRGGDGLTPILANGDDMLIAESRDGDRRVWIVSDPDFLENHGLANGQNADVAVALINYLRNEKGSVIFDDALHGMFKSTVSPFRRLFEFPLVIAVVLGAIAAALLLWATLGRFGNPGVAPPSFDFGKRRLIATSASLLDRAGHHSAIMHRYVQLILRDTGQALHLPREQSDAQLAQSLDIIGEARGIEPVASQILARSEQLRADDRNTALMLFRVAGDIHQWKDTISHGTSRRRGDR